MTGQQVTLYLIDITNAVIKVDSQTNACKWVFIKNIAFIDGAIAPLSCYVSEGMEQTDIGGMINRLMVTSYKKKTVFRVDGQLLNRKLVFSFSGQYNTYPMIYIYVSNDSVNYTTAYTNQTATFTITDSYTFTAAYNYVKIACTLDGTGSNDYYYYVLLSRRPVLSLHHLDCCGEAEQEKFSLLHSPDSDLVVYVNGVETVDYTLTGTSIVFTNAPASSAAITADYKYLCNITASYKVPYIPKSEDYVLDVTMELQFGEGDL